MSNDIISKINICFKKYSGFAVSAEVQCGCAVFCIIIGNHFFKMKIMWTCVCGCSVRTNFPPHAYYLFHSPLLLHQRFWCCLDGPWCSWVNEKFNNRLVLLVLTQLCEYNTFWCLWSKILIKCANNLPFPHCFFWPVILHSHPFCTHLFFLHKAYFIRLILSKVYIRILYINILKWKMLLQIYVKTYKEKWFR